MAAALTTLAASVGAAAAPAYLGVERSWVVAGTGDFFRVMAVAVAPDSTVYALGSDKRVYAYTREGAFLRSFVGSTEPNSGLYYAYAVDLAVDSSGNVIVTQPSEDRVEKFSPSGELLAQWHFESPAGIARTHDGGLAMISGDGISWLSSTGDVTSTQAGARAGYSTDIKLAVDSRDRAYFPIAGDYKTGTWSVVRVSRAGTERMLYPAGAAHASADNNSNDPRGFTVDAADRVWTADPYNYRVRVYSSSGALLFTCGYAGAGSPMMAPVDLDAAPDGSIYVVDGLSIRHIAEVAVPAPACATPHLSLSGLKITPTRFRAAPLATYRRRGATVTYRLSEPAPVVATVSRVLRGGRRVLRPAQITTTGRAGLNRVRLSGWMPWAWPSGRPQRLPRGTYVLNLTATSYGQQRTASRTFVIR